MKLTEWLNPAAWLRSVRGVSASASPAQEFYDMSIAGMLRANGTTAGVAVNEERSLKYSAVFAATRVLCGTGGSLPLHLYRRIDLASKGLRGDGKERVRGSKLGRVLEWKPNADMDAVRFRRLMWHHQVNWGNAFAEIIRDDYSGEVLELHPMHPNRMTIERNKAGELRYLFRGDGVEPRTLTPYQMFHVPNIISHDGIVGIGVIEAARESVGFGLATEKYGANFFGKGGIPRLTIQFPGTLNDTMRKAFREEWQTIYGGGDGERVAVLQGGATAAPIDIPPEDSQFLETRQYNVEEVARWYGIPPHMLQRMVQVTYSNAEVLPLDFVKFTLLQYLEAWEAAINTQLVGEDEEDVFAKHNVNGLLRGDAKSRSEYLKGMTSSALMTRNEARAYEDLEPVEGGDTFLVQGATVPLDDDGKPISEFAGGAAVKAPMQPGESDDNSEDGTDTEGATPNSKRIASAAKVALAAELDRMAKKESKRAIEESGKPATFVERIDEFYAQHASIVTTAVQPHIDILSECGAKIEAPLFVSSWCESGKSAFLDAAGNSTYSTLQPTVKSFVDSREWSERPLRAVTALEASDD